MLDFRRLVSKLLLVYFRYRQIIFSSEKKMNAKLFWLGRTFQKLLRNRKIRPYQDHFEIIFFSVKKLICRYLKYTSSNLKTEYVESNFENYLKDHWFLFQLSRAFFNLFMIFTKSFKKSISSISLNCSKPLIKKRAFNLL